MIADTNSQDKSNLNNTDKMIHNISRMSRSLSQWYLKHQRVLPWRQKKSPYFIWISEIMLQQTTVQVVAPYFERFITRFPSVEVLATADISDVLEHWAGLGYYSRARNLHKAAQLINQQGFPQRYADLLELPGFGPYTAAAVASISFEESVGVVDGNVIRVVSRVLGQKIKHWDKVGRAVIQDFATALTKSGVPSVINQGLMELGATVCTQHNPNCLMCPWTKVCEARKLDLVDKLPLKKPRKESEHWTWEPQVIIKNGKIALEKNVSAPFLKNQWLLPARCKKVQVKPIVFDLQHSITHHKIYVKIKTKNFESTTGNLKGDILWVPLNEVRKISPFSLIEKTILKFQKEKN